MICGMIKNKRQTDHKSQARKKSTYYQKNKNFNMLLRQRQKENYEAMKYNSAAH